jgi:O-antigen/teichoic acid export membrane protein
VLKNGFYNTIGGILRISLSLLSVPILIRILGIENYGLWTLASSVIGIITLAEGGLSVSTTFFLSQDIVNEDKKGISETLTATFLAILMLAMIAACFLYFSADLIVSFFPRLSKTENIQALVAFKVGSIVLWTRLLQQNLVGILQAYEKYGLLNLLSTVQVSINTIGLIVVVLQGGRIIEMMEWQAFQSVGLLVLYLWISTKIIGDAKPRFRLNKSKSILILRYSSIAWIGTLGSALFTQSDRLIVGAILDARALGLYAAITSVVSQINTISALPVSPLLPTIAKLQNSSLLQKKERKKQLKQGIELNALIALGMGALIVMLSGTILKLIAGEIFDKNSIYALQTGAVIYSIYSLNAVGYYVLYAIGKIKICTTIHLASAIVSVAMIAVLSMHIQLLGAILGNGIYIFTFYMTILGLSELGISKKELVGWLILPFSWFLISVVSSLYFQSFNGYIKVLIFVLEVTPLLLWFIWSNSFKIKDMKIRT